MRWPRRRVLVAGAIAVVALAAAGIWALWPDHRPAPPRARQYTAFSACLATDPQGVAGQPAAAVWAGMQDASLKTLMKVSYLAVPGQRSADNIRPYIAGLVQKKCDIVVAADPLTVTTAADSAAAFPTTRFLLVGTAAGGRNVVTVPGDPAALRASVATELERLAA
jgi:hypothetical protein